MNSTLKRMFEEDCSDEEAQLHAAVLGKTYEECKEEWAREYKKEFVLANSNILMKYDYVADQHGKFNFVMAMQYYGDLLAHKIMECPDVECSDIVLGGRQVGRSSFTFTLTVSFYEFEIDKAFMKKVKAKINKLVEPI